MPHLPHLPHLQEQDLRLLIDQVRQGQLPRRGFIQRLVGLGLTVPMASMLLLHEGIAQTPAAIPYKPTKRGGGGTLKILAWQGAVHLNPHFAQGAKEREASRIFYEPLAGWDDDGNLVPQLAAEIPGRHNGGLSADGRTVTWKLKRGVTWHDGMPFTADDVVFTAAYAADPAAGMTTMGAYRDIQVLKIDTHTVQVIHPQPVAHWAQAMIGSMGLILPRHVFEPYRGANSRDNPANLRPVGTGPYRIVDFKPADLVRAEAFAGYHVPHQPFFDALEIKGGGDSVSAARAVLQTGEYDLAWTLVVEHEILSRLEKAGKGRVLRTTGGDVELIVLNASDPWTEVEGERGSARSRHPAFSDKAVRTALSLLLDRQGLQQVLGPNAVMTGQVLNNPPRFRGAAAMPTFSIAQANQVLEAAGWIKGPDGIRAKGGAKLKLVYQTTVNGERQKVQAVIKDACSKAGIDIEIKAVTPSVFFGGDVANPDTNQKFRADLQMHQFTMIEPDPQAFMGRFTSGQMAQKANKWAGRNTQRWSHAEYDALFKAAQIELDPVKRAAMFIRMNELLVNDGYVIPLYCGRRTLAAANKLVPALSAWDANTWAIGSWYRET
ncbi:MAG: peptide ABC transporter substrate-binding protein [Rubrivivax sp.]|nr:peptide ABC transporter substrate-binding protein [Rubrivivax sp.]